MAAPSFSPWAEPIVQRALEAIQASNPEQRGKDSFLEVFASPRAAWEAAQRAEFSAHFVLPAEHFIFGETLRDDLWTFYAFGTCKTSFGSVIAAELIWNTYSQHGSVPGVGLMTHGGASAAVIDGVNAWAGNVCLNGMALTATQSFVYNKPMMVGQRYVIVAQCLDQDLVAGKSAIVRSSFFNSKGEICVSSKTEMRVPRARL